MAIDRKPLFALLPLVASMALLSSCYVTRQALYQNNLFNNRELISEVLKSGEIDGKDRIQLIELGNVMEYAKSNGLNSADAYRYYIATEKPVVSYLVYAAFADRLESKTWWFPFVGRVPYLGFFDSDARDSEADQLAAEGFDIHKSGVGAFSSLGWFEDPIYTSMLRRSRADFAHLIFHELTHRTYWSPGSVRFNENLAEYVGEELTERYLKSIDALEEYREYDATREDRILHKAWLKTLKQSLEDLYENPPANRQELMRQKQEIFDRFTKGSDRPKFKQYDFIGKRPWNNARVLALSLYSPDVVRFRRAHNCLGTDSIPAFLKALEDRESDHDDQFKVLDSLCTGGSY